MEDKLSRSARLLDLIQALRGRRRPVTATKLADELGVSLRTVYRDIATLIAVLPEASDDVAATSGMLVGPGASAMSPHMTVIRRAMQSEHSLRLRYTDKKGVSTERVVWPVALGFLQAAEVLVAWIRCNTRWYCTLPCWVFQTPEAQIKESLFASFSSDKEGLKF